jgi:hypothetical protein
MGIQSVSYVSSIEGRTKRSIAQKEKKNETTMKSK